MIKSITKIMLISGVKSENAARPKAGISATNICSPPYADEEMQSDERIPNARLFDRRCSFRLWRFSGAPSKNFFKRYVNGSLKCACSCSATGSGASSVQDLGTSTPSGVAVKASPLRRKPF